MRVEDYVSYFRDHGGDKNILGAVDKTWNKFLDELEAMIKHRRPASDKDFAVILDELDAKWRGFARVVKSVREDGFENLVRMRNLMMHRAWMRGRRAEKDAARKSD